MAVFLQPKTSCEAISSQISIPPASSRRRFLTLPTIVLVYSTALPSYAYDAALSNPYELGKMQKYGLDDSNRIRDCLFNPNCVSTAATSGCYSPAWQVDEDINPKTALESFQNELVRLEPEMVVIEKKQVNNLEKWYAHFRVPDRLFQAADIEVLIGPDSTGDTGLVVTYRSMAAQLKYVWPIQQPITDFGTQRKRMKALRQALGWRVIGCDLLECYSEE